jgi:hypothetical protein
LGSDHWYRESIGILVDHLDRWFLALSCVYPSYLTYGVLKFGMRHWNYGVCLRLERAWRRFFVVGIILLPHTVLGEVSNALCIASVLV